MKPFCAWLVIAAAAVGALDLGAAAEDNLAMPKAFCAERWPQDFVMQKHCIEEQVAAAIDVAKMIDGLPEGSEPRQAVARCAMRWQGEDGQIDYVMARHCAVEQLEAFLEILEQR